MRWFGEKAKTTHEICANFEVFEEAFARGSLPPQNPSYSYLSACTSEESASSRGRIRLSMMARSVASTTGDLPKMMLTHSGKEDRASEACAIPMPRAAASPTMEVFR